MPTKRKTLAEARYPDMRSFLRLGSKWANALGDQINDLLWKAYDSLAADVLSEVNVSQADDDLERNLTMLLESRLHKLMNGAEMFYVQHGTYEEESRQPAPAQPPMYDIAFILNANPRFIWPAEAKILHTDAAVSPYVSELRSNFLSCRYSPFSSQGAMLGYLRKGSAEQALRTIGPALRSALRKYAPFWTRAHRISNHTRKVPAGKTYARKFRCHHLIMPLKIESLR